MRNVLLIAIVLLLAILVGVAAVQLSPLVFGQEVPDGETLPVPEPTQSGTIPASPVAPQSQRYYVALVFGGNSCAPDLFYWCGGMR